MHFPEYRIDTLEQTDALLQMAEPAGIYSAIPPDENLNSADCNPSVSNAYPETVRRSKESEGMLGPDYEGKFGPKPFDG